MRSTLHILPFLLIVSFSTAAQSANGSATVTLTLSEIALLDIEPNNSPIALTIDPPIEAGNSINSTTVNNAKWLNYTSAVATGSSRNIAVQITSGSLPSGVSLSLNASSFAGVGMGTTGVSTGSVTLSGSPQVIISGIGGAYTGNGTNNGHSLNYSLNVANINLLKQEAGSTVTVTFTLIDN